MSRRAKPAVGLQLKVRKRVRDHTQLADPKQSPRRFPNRRLAKKLGLNV